MNKGIVIRQVGGKFTIKTANEKIVLNARGKLRDNGLYVGDEVCFENGAVSTILPRKNKLIRPCIANVDTIVVVVAEKPETDFVLIDKLIMYADKNNIEVIICVNKSDISENLYKQIVLEYSDVVSSIVKTSAVNNDVNELLPLLTDKISVFAGQSAVGKSTLLNAILKKNIAKVGELSKIEKGKNTTRETTIYEIDDKSFIADTPGFSCLELINFTPEEVSSGYTEFFQLSKNCRYRQCDHIFVDRCDCAVLRELDKNKDLNYRYERYKNLFIESRDKWRNKYGK